MISRPDYFSLDKALATGAFTHFIKCREWLECNGTDKTFLYIQRKQLFLPRSLRGKRRRKSEEDDIDDGRWKR